MGGSQSLLDPGPAGGGHLLVRGGTVLTMDSRYRVWEGADVLVQGGVVAAIGHDLEAPPSVPVIDATGDFVLPGFIQGHVHLGQTLFRGLAEGRRLLAWLRERIWPLEAAHDDESAYWGGLLGAAECLLGGTTTIQDIGIGPGIGGLLTAIRESRLRAAAGLCLMDEGEGLPAGLRQDPEAALAECEALAASFVKDSAGRRRWVLNPRFILSCSDAMWARLVEASRRHGWAVHTHALEQLDETELVRALKGRDEVEYFDDVGVLDADLRMAHGVWLDESHLRRVGTRRVSVVHCPSSNLKLGSGVADLLALRRFGVPRGIGADGAPCNNDLDVLEEVRLAALLQSVRHGPGHFPGCEALGLATREGAAALRMEDSIGSLEVGKRGDLVVLGGRAPELVGAAGVDVHDLVVFGAGRRHVRHVAVDGELLVSDGELRHLDLDLVISRSRKALADLIRRAGLELG